MEKYCPKCFRTFGAETERCLGDGTYLVSPEDRDLTGQVLDERYTVLERIGRGGMGVVYKAEQHLIKRVVALKVLRREMVQDQTAVKRFMVEAQAIASLGSRFTVTLHDFGVTRDGLIYYTMELLKGQPLARVIRNEGPLEYRRAARLAMQVCESLDEAHERGILHRDIKPENIFVVPDRRGKEEAKVLDFGIAKLVGDTSAESMTKTGMIVGTPAYLSPEQAMGNPVVPASDLYSLGIVLYEMLAGTPPFEGETPMKTLWAHVKDPVPAITAKNPSVVVPRSLELFLERALDKDPGRRFQSAVAFRDALKRALEDHEARPETVALTALSTTDEGVRVRTEELFGTPKNVATKPDKRPIRDRTVAYADEPPDGPSRGRAGPPDEAALGLGVTLTAEDPLSGSLEPSQADGTGSRKDSAVRPSEIGTAFLHRPRRMRVVLSGLGGLLVLVAVVLLWRPWEAARESPAAQVTRPEPQVADKPVPAPVPVAGEAEAAPAGTAQEDAGKLAQEAAAAKAAAEERKKGEEDAARRKADEAARAEAELEAKKKADEDAARKAAEEEAARKAAEEAARKKADEEAAAKKASEEEAARIAAEQAAAEQEAAKKAAEQEAARKKAAQAEAERKAEERARKQKVENLVGKADQAIQDKRWKACVGYIEQAIAAGGSMASVRSKLEKCRDMSVYEK
ncbi:MAG: serine/threonine protein kinase [Deltaproteobacteria bacterium]|nr:serine/threonine protein kinase [Deltaproteobacteria bacterium]